MKYKRGNFEEPIREGIRGGLGLFKWENIRQDKQKSHYLGSSLYVPSGRAYVGKDLMWYSRNKTEEGDVQEDEITRIKRQEAEAMAIALGQQIPKLPDAKDNANLEPLGSSSKRESHDKSEKKKKHLKKRSDSRERQRRERERSRSRERRHKRKRSN